MYTCVLRYVASLEIISIVPEYEEKNSEAHQDMAADKSRSRKILWLSTRLREMGT